MTDRSNPLRQARRALGMSPTAAAEALGISVRHVHRIELRAHLPHAELREAIRALYGADVLARFESIVAPRGNRWARPLRQGSQRRVRRHA